MEEILSTLKNWVLEAFSARNDGWVQNGDYLNSIENLELHGEEDE